VQFARPEDKVQLSEMRATAKYPAVHAEQAVLPLVEYSPSGQVIGRLDAGLTGQNFPAAHWMHETAPACEK
jgi:hypothetical protein